MEIYVFCIMITLIFVIIIFACGVCVGQSTKKETVEISDDADILATDLRLMAAISNLSNGEKDKLSKAADYIEKLGEIKN